MKAQEASAGTFFAQLLCDIMIPAEFSAAIRAQGYDVAEARALPVGVQQDDRAILAEAARQRRAVITCNYSDPNSNFYLIHEEWRTQSREHAGIILIPQAQISNRLLRWDVRDRLLSFLNRHTADELSNQVWWLPLSRKDKDPFMREFSRWLDGSHSRLFQKNWILKQINQIRTPAAHGGSVSAEEAMKMPGKCRRLLDALLNNPAK